MLDHDFGEYDKTQVDATPRIDKRSLPGYELGVRRACDAWITVCVVGGTDPRYAHQIAQEVAQVLLKENT